VFLGIPLAALLSARGGGRGWSRYSVASAVAMTASAALAGAGFGQRPGLTDSAGLYQRAAIVTGFGWLTALMVRAGRPSSTR
jgi:hypothetical protein